MRFTQAKKLTSILMSIMVLTTNTIQAVAQSTSQQNTTQQFNEQQANAPQANAPQTAPGELSSLTVLQADASLQPIFDKMVADFNSKGPNSVALGVLQSMNDSQTEEQWKQILASTKIRVISVDVHPNQQAAVTWMNKRFEKMGIPQLQLLAKPNPNLADSTELSDKEIKLKKWIRYSAGPGVAMAATYLGLPALSEVKSVLDYGLLVLPTVGVGLTTILLEFQFAHPWLNNHFWKKVWEFGGPVTGRFTNIFVNFLYGMSLYGAGIGASHLPELFGRAAVEYSHLPFMQAVISAFIGGVVFHIAMGQYQTDISLQQTRGNMTASERYSRETTGVVVNNGARVLNWVLPSWDWLGYLAQWGFFTIKTAPQFWQTYVTPYRVDKQIKARVQELKMSGSDSPGLILCKELL